MCGTTIPGCRVDVAASFPPASKEETSPETGLRFIEKRREGCSTAVTRAQPGNSAEHDASILVKRKGERDRSSSKKKEGGERKTGMKNNLLEVLERRILANLLDFFTPLSRALLLSYSLVTSHLPSYVRCLLYTSPSPRD